MNLNYNRNCNILCWNIRGLNSAQKWLALSEKISESSCSIICLQETKRDFFDHSYIRKFCPRRFDKFIFHPSLGNSGGLIVIWNNNTVSGTLIENLPFAISIEFTSNSSLHEVWTLSNIYGPCSGEQRDFVSWLNNLEINIDQNWILMGDFNFIRSVQNRNLPGGDMNDILIFNEIISNIGLIEVPLKGLSYTWSNMQEQPLLQQLDWVFTSLAWTLKFPHTSVAKYISDHAPCMISIETSVPKSKLFRFENFWTDMPGFMDVVSQFWSIPVRGSNQATKLNGKLKNLRRGLKSWSKRLYNLHAIISNCNEVLLFSDNIEEQRPFLFKNGILE